MSQSHARDLQDMVSRQRRTTGSSAGDGIIRFVGAMGAIGGVAAITAKVVKEVYSGNCDTSPPASVEHQILTGKSTRASVSKEDNDGLTIQDLERMAMDYREQIAISTSIGNWERVTWLSETQKIVHNIMDIRQRLDSAVQAGDFSTVSTLTPKVLKAQKDLSNRCRQDTCNDEMPCLTGKSLGDEQTSSQSTCGSYFGIQDEEDEGKHEELSQDEVQGILQSVESKMSNADTSIPTGITKWRALHAEKKLYQEILSTFDKIEVAKVSEDMDALESLSEEMRNLQSRVFGQVCPPSSQKRGLLSGIKECLGFKVLPATEDALLAKKQVTTPEGRNARSRKRKASDKGTSLTSKAGKTKLSKGNLALPASRKSVEDEVSFFRPRDLLEPCPTTIPWEATPIAPTGKFDLSDSAMAFTAPNGITSVPEGTWPTFAGLNEDLVLSFIESAKECEDRSPEVLLSLLPKDCSLDQDQTRHLFRNFSDAMVPTPSSDYIRLSRREFDIMVFCRRRNDLGIEACHRLMPYRDLEDVQHIWQHLFQRNNKDINLECEMSQSFFDDLRTKVGLLVQLEGLLGSTVTSRGRAVLPPTSFVADSFGNSLPSKEKRAHRHSLASMGSTSGGKYTTSKSAATGKPLVYMDPIFSSTTKIQEGTLVQDQDNRLFYVARGSQDETLADVANELSRGNHEYEMEEPVTLEALIAANSVRYTKGSLKANAPLNPATLLVVPPHKWPMRPREDKGDDKKCDKCASATDESTMLLCDGACDVARHMKCCDPPFTEVPRGEWFCSESCKRGC